MNLTDLKSINQSENYCTVSQIKLTAIVASMSTVGSYSNEADSFQSQILNTSSFLTYKNQLMRTFSMASSEVLLTPFEKYSTRARAHGMRSPAVRAASSSSPSTGNWGSSIIFCSILKNHTESCVNNKLNEVNEVVYCWKYPVPEGGWRQQGQTARHLRLVDIPSGR